MSPVSLSPVLILVGKVQLLLDMTGEEKRLLDLGSGYQVLSLEGITNGLGADSDVGDVLKLTLELGGSISLACGDKSHQLTAIIGGELRRTTTRVLFQRASDLRA